MRMLVFPVILTFVLTIGIAGTIGVMTVFPELATVYPEQVIETAIAQSEAQGSQHRADIGTTAASDSDRFGQATPSAPPANAATNNFN